MIVPRTRLLFWLAWTGIPLAIAHAIEPAAARALWGIAIGFAVAVLIDALRVRQRLVGVTLQAPPIVRMQKDAEGSIPLEFHRPAERCSAPLRLRMGLLCPETIALHEEERLIDLPINTPSSCIALICTPTKRGSYPIPGGVVEATSPFGFWATRRTLPLATEVRVYPNLNHERQATALFMARGQNGIRIRRATGRGREFEKIRDYLPGDPTQDIHWKASAKRRTPVTKVFQIERSQEVMVVLDASRLTMAVGPDGHSILERSISAALVLALAARQQGDHFGLAAFSDRLLRFVKPRSGKNHFQVCRDLLFALEPAPVAPDFHEIATALRLRLRKRTLVIFLTALDDPGTAEAFRQSVPPLCRQHLLLVNMVRPGSAAPLFTGAPPETTDEIYHRLGGHLLWRELRELQRNLKSEGVTLSLFDHEQLALQLVQQYLTLRARQML